jgi:hypothetical protein
MDMVSIRDDRNKGSGGVDAAARQAGDECLAAALKYLARGWSALADCPPDHAGVGKAHEESCANPGKVPWGPWKVFQARLPTEAELRRKWRDNPYLNVGIALGGITKLVGLDIDGAAGEELLRRLSGGDVPATLEFTSGTGRRLLYRVPDGADLRPTPKPGGLQVESGELRLLGTGSQTVMPPSRHKESGRRYAWVAGHGVGEIEPPVAPAWAVAYMTADAPPQGNGLPSSGFGKVTATSGGASITDRAIAYLAKMPVAVMGQKGSNPTLEAARVVVYGFDLGRQIGFQLLKEHYNPRCEPPWSDGELWHKCEDADTKPFGKPRGWLLQEDRPPKVRGGAAAKTPVPLPDYEPFPCDALPALLREYVEASAAALLCDPALVAPHALAVAAAAIGNSRAIELKRGWKEPAIVWATTVAPSGRLKSPAFDKAVQPYQGLQLDLIDAHQAKAEARDAWEKLPRDNRPPEPDDPGPEPCIVTSDATIEAVGELLRDNGRGLLLARDELDGWFQGFTRFKKSGGGTDRPHWLELHRAHTLRIHRLTRERGPLTVRRACCSLCGTIQPAVLARCLDSEAVAAGLGARFLLAMPPMKQRRWTEAEVAEDLAKQYEQLLGALHGLKLADEKKRLPHTLSLSRQAKAVWVKWFDRWCERQACSQDEQAAVLAKLEAYAARLALVHHVVTWAGAKRDDLREVDEESMVAGTRLAEWFAGEAWRIYATLRESEDQRRSRTLLEWIASRGGRISARQLQESLRHRYPLAENAKAALDELVKAELGHWQEVPAGPKGGQPTRHFVLRDTRPHNHSTHRTTDRADSDGQEPNYEPPHGTPSGMQKTNVTEGSVGIVSAVFGDGSHPDEPGQNGEVLRAQEDTEPWPFP